ncbi:MAG TPA: GFA family protein [Steroidobacteraceae bacterium]|jgi:hypothetical protein|nr:GFA family protein [Steroidobacteraceae bacterium]HXP25026.1 GFA family protein [Steroidobacteraceae bacterium]
MKVDGQCHCGQIRYEAEIDPANVSVCHCTDCQILTGTAYRVSAPASAASLVFRAGAPKIYIKTAESGNKRAQGFCSNCGTPIYSADAQNPQSYFLRVGTMSQRAALPPQRQIWCRSALAWASDIRGLEPSERA